jgi:hypothetical protein
VLQLLLTANDFPSSLIIFTLKMEEIGPSETSVLTKATMCHNPENDILLPLLHRWQYQFRKLWLFFSVYLNLHDQVLRVLCVGPSTIQVSIRQSDSFYTDRNLSSSTLATAVVLHYFRSSTFTWNEGTKFLEVLYISPQDRSLGIWSGALRTCSRV